MTPASVKNDARGWFGSGVAVAGQLQVTCVHLLALLTCTSILSIIESKLLCWLFSAASCAGDCSAAWGGNTSCTRSAVDIARVGRVHREGGHRAEANVARRGWCGLPLLAEAAGSL